MSLGKIIRNRRFNFLANAQIKFHIETKTGTHFHPKMENCSLTGIGAVLTVFEAKDESLAVGEIIPAAKISWEGHEYTLGRLAIQSVTPKQDGYVLLGFSLIDTKLPIDGKIGHFLDINGPELNPYEMELSPEKFSIATFSKAQHNSTDLFAKCEQYSAFFKKWQDRSRFLYKTVRRPSRGSRVRLTEKRPNGRDDYIVMGSNDYLGLSEHPKVCEAAQKAIDVYGFGSTGSPLTTGTTEIHEELKHVIAKTFNKEGALLFNSGYTANAGAIPAIVADQDLILADVISHVSIQDGMAMAKSTNRFFKHNNMDHLESMLAEQRANYAGTLLVTEGVFSMDGDVPDLERFVKLAKKYKARTYVDEAHSFGVVGENGLGACNKHNVTKDVDIIMGTFSKVCGGIGGFIAASEEVIDWYFWLARAHVFTVSIPPSTAAAMLTSMKILQEQPEIVQRLQSNIKHFVHGFRSLGANLRADHESAVIPIVIGDEKKIEIISGELMAAGVQVVPIVYPAVSRNGARFRFTVTASHTISDIDYVINVFENAMRKASFKFEDFVDPFADKDGLQRAA
jgi:8-amino-7-oxononanoate synthase